jgi:RNA polymerase sigma factor (sigma-70 family)
MTLDRLSDRALCAHAASDEAAFGELVRRYREALRRHAARYVGEADAEDVVQQALVNASLALRREPDRDIEPRPWLYKVTTNAAIDHRRARAARPLGDRIHEEPDFDTIGAAADNDPHQVVTGREAVRSVVSQIQSLSPNQRRAATARFLEGRSHDEIAGELGVSKGAARELIHRARRNLREAIPALSPLPLLERLRHAVSGVVGSASAPAAKLVAGAAVIAAATGGGAAIVASSDGGNADRLPVDAAQSKKAAAVTEVPREPSGGRAPGDARGGGDGGGRAGGGASSGPASAGRVGGGGADAEPAGVELTPVAPAAGGGPATGGGAGAGPVQGVADDLGVGGVTEQVPLPETSPSSQGPKLPGQLPVKPPDLPPVGGPLGNRN